MYLVKLKYLPSMWIVVSQNNSSWHFYENDCKQKLKKLVKGNQINYSKLKHPREGNKELRMSIKTFLFWNHLKYLKTDLEIQRRVLC